MYRFGIDARFYVRQKHDALHFASIKPSHDYDNITLYLGKAIDLKKYFES